MALLSGCDPAWLVQSSNLAASPQRESLTPHKLALLILIQLYCDIPQRSSAPLSPRQRKDACLLLLQLLQGGELDAASLLQQCRLRLPAAYCSALQLLLQRLSTQGVEGVTELMASVEILLLDVNSRKPYQEVRMVVAVCCSSVVGLFVRRMLLAFSRTPFHQVAAAVADFSAHYSALMLGPAAAAPVPADGCLSGPDTSQPPSRRQTELMLSTQMELLQTNEKLAWDPASLQAAAARMLRHAPDTAQVHFLSFLNSLRVSELSGAVHSLYHSFDRMTPTAGNEDDCRGLRYAALALACLHARFGHRQAALAAIREAVTMSQDGNDSVCLQRALTWLYLLADDDETRETLMRHAIQKSGELQLPELLSLGVQNFTLLMACRGAKPADALQQLARSDQLTCQHSLPLLMSSGYVVRAAVCELYGQPALGALCAQLLLCLDTAGASGAPVCGESAALAAAQLARHLCSDGEYVLAEQVLSWAAGQLLPGSRAALQLRRARLQLQCDAALLAGRCHAAEHAAVALTGIDVSAGRLRRAQLHLLRGELAQCQALVEALLEAAPVPERRVQLLLLRAELLTAAADYAGAAEPLLAALSECDRRRLSGARRSVQLRLATLQLQLGLRQQAAELAQSLTLPLLTHGAPVERARLGLLQARCWLAQQPPQPRRAVPLLKQAARTLHRLQAWLLLKPVLHTRAMVHQQLGERAERNAAAAQFRQLLTQHPTIDGVHLIRMA